jgi:hypothetical protein
MPSLDRRRKAWLYVSMEIDTFKARLGGSESDQRLAVLQLLAKLGAGFASAEDLQKVEKYFTEEFPEEQGGLPQFVLHALDEIRRNIASKEILEGHLCDWLESARN